MQETCSEEYQHSSAFCVTLDCYCRKLTRNSDHHNFPFCSDTLHHCELLDSSEHLKGKLGVTSGYFCLACLPGRTTICLKSMNMVCTTWERPELSLPYPPYRIYWQQMALSDCILSYSLTKQEDNKQLRLYLITKLPEVKTFILLKTFIHLITSNAQASIGHSRLWSMRDLQCHLE